MQDDDAIRQLRRGRLSGLTPLVERYQVQALRTAMLITRDRASAEDVVQALFVNLPRAIRTFEDGRPFAPWFLRSVARSALQAARAAERWDGLPDDRDEGAGELPEPGPLLEDLVEARERRNAIAGALQGLPPDQRTAVVLRYFLDMSEREMAEFFDVPPGTIKWRLHAARQQLRALLRPSEKGVADE